MTNELKVVSTKALAELLGKTHNEVMFMISCIVVKHPHSVSEFPIRVKDGKVEAKVTHDGLELIVEFLSITNGIEKLLRLMEVMTEGE